MYSSFHKRRNLRPGMLARYVAERKNNTNHSLNNGEVLSYSHTPSHGQLHVGSHDYITPGNKSLMNHYYNGSRLQPHGHDNYNSTVGGVSGGELSCSVPRPNSKIMKIFDKRRQSKLDKYRTFFVGVNDHMKNMGQRDNVRMNLKDTNIHDDIDDGAERGPEDCLLLKLPNDVLVR